MADKYDPKSKAFHKKYLSNEAEVFIEKPVQKVYRWVVYEPLEKQLTGTKELPGVTSTKTLNNISLGEAGHKRLVCLADGNIAVEEHTYIDTNNHNVMQKYFSYKVSDYTFKIARNIEYATGEWWFILVKNSTQIRWRYSFKLNDKKLLGKLGPIGRFLFNIFFIKTSYNDFMVKTLRKLKSDLENV